MPAALQQGLEHHRAGRLEKAERIYGRVLERDPRNPDAWHLLGRVALERGDFRSAAARVLAAIQGRPEAPAFHSTLGDVLAAQGRSNDAALCYREALRRDPQFLPALVNLGNALQAQGRLRDACVAYWQAIQSQPDCADAFMNLGNALRAQGERQEAMDCYAEAYRLNPRSAELCANLAAVLLETGRHDEAEQWARRAVAAAPGSSDLHARLGSILIAAGKFAEAEAACRAALKLRPDDAEAACNLGSALQSQAGRSSEALAWLDEVVRRHPERPQAHFCRALSLLAAGRLREGFAEYEWRWKLFPESPRACAVPAWDGSCPAGRTILLSAEQGLGDTLQFVRYATPLAARGARIIVECQPAVAELVETVEGVTSVIAPADPLPQCDAQAALMSLPRLMGTTIETIPAGAPYTKPDPALVEELRRDLGPARGLRVGLAWSGNPKHNNDRRRSIPLATFDALRWLPGIEWFSLHVGEPAEGEVRRCGGWVRHVLTDAQRTDRLAALVAILDLVISVDTMAAHLAGAMGRPVWTLLSAPADWRWLQDRTDSPWYPGMRLFRQRREGDWPEVISRVAEALSEIKIQGRANRTDMHK